MRPEPPPMLRVQRETDPLPGAVGEAMKEATITLWRDLWQKVERVELAREDILATVRALEELLDKVPSGAVNKRWFRARLSRAHEVISRV